MKCFHHPEIDAVGSCQECGKGACKSCIEYIDGEMLCKDCVALIVEEIHEEEVEVAGEARKAIVKSMVFTVLGVLFGFMVGGGTPGVAGKILLPIFFGYFFFSTYWGMRWLWPRWLRFQDRVGVIFFFPLIGWLFFLMFLWEIAAMYGMAGGAIYQYIKHKRLASPPAPEPALA